MNPDELRRRLAAAPPMPWRIGPHGRIHDADMNEVLSENNPFMVAAVNALPELLGELDRQRILVDKRGEQVAELARELDELRSAVRSLFTHGGQMVSAAPGTYRNLWSLVANNTDTCRGPDGQATRTETNQ